MPLASLIISLSLYWILSSSGLKVIAWLYGLILFIFLLYFAIGDVLIDHADVFISLGRGREGIESIKTLTGRTFLWKECIKYVADRPLLGLGYNTSLSPALIMKVSAAINWIPSDAHSGYIENLLGLGIIGIMAFVGIIICSFQRAFSLLRSSNDYLLVLTVLTWIYINSLLESIITQPVFPAFLSMILLAKLGFVKREEPDSQEIAKGTRLATREV